MRGHSISGLGFRVEALNFGSDLGILYKDLQGFCKSLGFRVREFSKRFCLRVPVAVAVQGILKVSYRIISTTIP